MLAATSTNHVLECCPFAFAPHKDLNRVHIDMGCPLLPLCYMDFEWGRKQGPGLWFLRYLSATWKPHRGMHPTHVKLELVIPDRPDGIPVISGALSQPKVLHQMTVTEQSVMICYWQSAT
jgi:hypothetical protein